MAEIRRIDRYSFESYCTSDNPTVSSATSPDISWGGDVDTNVQWCSVVRTVLGDIPMVLGGEVDCLKGDTAIADGIGTSSFIELKTNLVIETPYDEMRFER